MYYICHKLMSILNGVVNILILRTGQKRKYVAIVILDYDEIGKSAQIITKICPFINEHNWFLS